MSRGVALIGILVCAGLVAGAARPASRPAPVKLAIGKPVPAPAHPRSGRRFTVAFALTRNDGTAPVERLVVDTSIGSNPLRFTKSYARGKVRISVLVPVAAVGKRLKVRVEIGVRAQTATRVATFPILRGQRLNSLSIGDVSAAEGTGDPGKLEFPVTLSAADPQMLTVRYATVDGTAVAPGDYVAATGTVTFAPGTTRQLVTVEVVGDRKFEPDEQLRVVLSRPVHVTIADGSATGTIVADDFGVQVGPYEGTTSQGGAISFDVTLDGEMVRDLVVRANRSCDGQGGTWETLDYTFDFNAMVQRDLSFNAGFWSSSVPAEVWLYGDLAENAPATGGVTLTWRDGWRCKLTWSAS